MCAATAHSAPPPMKGGARTQLPTGVFLAGGLIAQMRKMWACGLMRLLEPTSEKVGDRFTTLSTMRIVRAPPTLPRQILLYQGRYDEAQRYLAKAVAGYFSPLVMAEELGVCAARW